VGTLVQPAGIPGLEEKDRKSQPGGDGLKQDGKVSPLATVLLDRGSLRPRGGGNNGR